MQRNAAIIIGASIFLGFLTLGLLVRPNSTIWHGSGGATDGEAGRYQFIRANDVTVAVLDTRTGRVWMKFIGSNEGPAKWSEDGPELTPLVVQQMRVPPAAGSSKGSGQ